MSKEEHEMSWHPEKDPRRARIFPTEAEARAFGESLVSGGRIESYRAVEVAVEPDAEWRSHAGTRYLPLRKLPSYAGDELVYGVVDETLLFAKRPDVAVNTRFLSALLAARTWYQLRCLVTPSQLDWVVDRVEGNGGPEVPPRGNAPFDFYELPGAKDGSIFAALTALPGAPIPADLKARYGFGEKVTGFGYATGERTHVGFDPSVAANLLPELDRIGFRCVPDDVLIAEAVWGPDEVGLKRERERTRELQRADEIGAAGASLERDLEDVVNVYLRRLEEDAGRRGDTPQDSLQRTYECLRAEADAFGEFLLDHYDIDADAIDVDAWVGELVRGTATFWTKARACGVFAQRMLCVGTGSAYVLWERELAEAKWAG
jgi:hypothetical protein